MLSTWPRVFIYCWVHRPQSAQICFSISMQTHRCHERFRILGTAAAPVCLVCEVFSTVKGAEENTPEFHYWVYSPNQVRYWKSITRNVPFIWIPNWWPESHDQFYTAVAWMSYIPLAIYLESFILLERNDFRFLSRYANLTGALRSLEIL